jgi:TM2 domain-containing membrane protein YozV
MSVPRPGKNKVLAYILWFFFGTLGAHRYYVGHIGKGLLFLGATIVAIAIAPFGFPVGIVSAILGLGIFVFWVIDAFKLGKFVEAAGEQPGKTNE